jgi:hypothetical protein
MSAAPTGNMHRALQIKDLIVDIFTSCWENPPHEGRTLARLARCCSVFSEPAFQLLWETVDLRNLLALFDPSLFPKYRGKSRSTKVKTTVRIIACKSRTVTD